MKPQNLKIKIRSALFQKDNLEFHASCSEGLAELLEEEVKSHKLLITDTNRGGVYFRGENHNLISFILNTGFSSRVAVTLTEFRADDEDELYNQAKKFPWEKLITNNKSFRIESYTKDALKNSQYSMYRLKDAILDRARDQGFIPPVIDRENPDILILLRNNRNHVKIQVSVTPYPLNQRGYRVRQHEAPIKETIAQAMIKFSGWDRKSVLIDPMCGSGTILIEAALLARGLPLNHGAVKSYIFEQLFGDYKIPEKEDKEYPVILGYDIDSANIRNALINASAAGVDHMIKFRARDALKLDNPGFDHGVIITNPPYGVRLSNKDSLIDLYNKFGKLLLVRFPGFTFTVISGEISLLGHFKLKAEETLNLRIAGLKAKIVNYKIQ